MNSDLYDHPALYDALLPVRAHLRYYQELARHAAGGVLELACGTGQLTLPIAAEGVPIAGLDMSLPMLNTARDRAAAAKISTAPAFDRRSSGRLRSSQAAPGAWRDLCVRHL